MAKVLLLNPRRRRKRRMSALQRKYFGKRRRSGATRSRRRRRSHAVMSNPRRRRRSLTRMFRRRRRNPSFRGALSSVRSGVVPTLKGGLVGAVGALGLDALWGYGKDYLPASIAGSPLAQYAAKLLGAVLVGFVGNKLLRGKGQQLATGAATVVLHDAMKAQIQASFPSIKLGEYLTYAPTVGTTRRAGRLLSTGVGEYLSGIPNDADGGMTDDMDYTGEYNGDGINGGW